MNALAHKSGHITESDLLHQLTLHPNRYHQSEKFQLPLSESISQQVAAAIAQGNETHSKNLKIPANLERASMNGNTNKKPRPEKPNSLPVLNCLFAALNKQNRPKDNEVRLEGHV